MDFSERVKDLAGRSKHATKHALTEEATKTSVVLPLIQTLGFDVFNLNEVVPEFVADVGLKKGEKVDFALKIDGKLAALVEVKPITMSLGSAQFSQLYRYFATTEARLAILTNGREIWFFSDVDEPNKMDKKPFFTFDLQVADDAKIADLARFQKHNFSIETILATASNLKYANAAGAYLKKQLTNPDEDFVKMVARNIYDGMLTKTVVEQLRPAIQASLDEVIRDRIQAKLNVTFRAEPVATEEQIAKPNDTEPEIVTTEDELQAFLIVRAIAARWIDLERITLRDSKTYCSVFADNNNRKPICKLYFNAKTARHVGLFDAEKVEERVQIGSLSDIYKYAARIEDAVKTYL
ncbi:type I restriction enzyme HsdR N-terminal domain-containing protein [Phaeovulum sp.]|uniref:type I restriction enzyme HsdR N-terminal domain-containing protein n=1 Tax=Phaeovulum sp. TaxID=2934796 RepID=UPI003565353C